MSYSWQDWLPSRESAGVQSAAERAADRPASGDGVPGMIRWSLYLFVATLPFEIPDHRLPIDYPTAAACVFLVATMRHPRLCYSRLPWAALWFAIYLYLFIVAMAFGNPFHLGEVFKYFLWLLQLWFVLWAGSNLLRVEPVARSTLLSFGLACFVRAALQVVGFGRTSHEVWTGGERVTAFGQNANMCAMILGAGIIALVGLSSLGRRALPFPRWLVWPFSATIGVALIETGSRGGLLALAMGLVVFFLAAKGSRTFLRNAVIGVLALGFMAAAATHSTMMRSRLEASAQEGALAGRQNIYPTALEMFLERPVLGWGPVNNKYVLGGRLAEQLRRRRGTHDIMLEVLTSTGMLGGFPFVIGILLAVAAGVQARNGRHGSLPIALTTVVAITNTSGDWIASKLLWVVMAYVLAAGAESADAIAHLDAWRLEAQRVWERQRAVLRGVR